MYSLTSRGFAISSLIEQMQHPAFFPHSVESPIRVVQTHISFVVLTGPYAYKLKKEVDLGFLDFSSLAKRHFYCMEELRLNSLFAPDLYVDVVSIFERQGQYTFEAGDSEPVEYAVRMHQFDESELLIHVLERGELTIDLATQLGERIAGIHKRTPVISPANTYGSADTMRESIRLNFATIEPFVGCVFPVEQRDRLNAFCLEVVEANAALLSRRIEQGFIRECHGDLHLRNICIHQHVIELFDRIEFNDAFKNIDTLYDLSFLLMDLRYRGHPELATRVMNVYLEVTGDYDGVVLLPLYECVRAIIRGEVSLLLSADDEADATVRAHAESEGVRHLDHAEEYTRKQKGSIVATCGLSGSGKSTFAGALALRSGAIHIRSDALRKHLSGVGLHARGADIYSSEHTVATYSRLIDLGVALSVAGHHVILDATFEQAQYRGLLIDRAKSANVVLHFAHCAAPIDIIRKRLAERTLDVSDATVELTDRQIEEFETFSEDEAALRIEVDTTREDAVNAVLNMLSTGSSGR